MRRERTQAIADKAARNSFIVLMLAVASIAVYFGSIARTDAPIALVCLLALLGMVVQLRRRHLAPSDVVAQRRTVGSDDEIKRFIAELPRHAVDLVIETPKILTFIGAKYLSDIDCQTTYDPYRGNTDIYVTVANVGSPLSATVVIMSTFLTIESWRVKNEILLS